MERNERTRKLAEEALNHLSAELEAGRSDALKAYLATMSRFRHYSWNNVLLIGVQRPDATRVAGIHAWNDLGRTVKKGEKGIMIFAPVVVKRDAPQAEQEPKEPKQGFRLAGFRTAYVFDVSQTDGKPLPELNQTTGDPKDYTEKLKALVAGRGIRFEYDPSIAPALGQLSNGQIKLQPGLSPAEEFATLAHELAHEMLDHQVQDAARLPRVVRETQAEAVAFVVCRGIGLETNNAAADYISLYNGDKKTLTESLAKIQETGAKILDHLIPEKAVRREPIQADRPAESVPGDRSHGSPTPKAPSRTAQEPSLSIDR